MLRSILWRVIAWRYVAMYGVEKRGAVWRGVAEPPGVKLGNRDGLRERLRKVNRKRSFLAQKIWSRELCKLAGRLCCSQIACFIAASNIEAINHANHSRGRDGSRKVYVSLLFGDLILSGINLKERKGKKKEKKRERKKEKLQERK